MNKTLVVVFALAGILGGCATQSAYVPAAHPGSYGYSESRIEADRYRVTFTGNASTSSEKVKDYAFLRAADLSLQEGKTWFLVVDRSTESSKRPADAARVGSSIGTDRVVTRSCGLLGCRDSVAIVDSGTAAFDDESTAVRNSYSSSLEIVMGNGAKPANVAGVYDAQEVSANVRQRMN